MNALASLIVAEHLLDLRREADSARLVHEAMDVPVTPNRPGRVSRLTGRSARGLSRRLAALAARVDPIEEPRQDRHGERRSRPATA
ncbi:MAG TPA: hypothetical protein VF484_09785 [Candidatus Limnocylindrales bacterium]